jgi:hypothetical protein
MNRSHAIYSYNKLGSSEAMSSIFYMNRSHAIYSYNKLGSSEAMNSIFYQYYCDKEL